MPAAWWPLHPTQRLVWDDQQRDPAGTATTIAGWLNIDGPLDAAPLLQAMRWTQAEIPALRLVFRCRNGEPEQRVAAPSPAPIRFLDLLADPDPPAAGLAWMRRVAAHPFRLDEGRAGGLLRTALLRLAPERHALFFAVHHIACDGVGLSAIGRCLAAKLDERLPDHPAFASVPDAAIAALHEVLVASVSAYRGSAGFAADRAHWQAVLQGAQRPPPGRRFSGDGSWRRVSRTLNVPVEAALRDLARRLRVHWAAIVTAALAIETWQRRNTPAVVLGTTVAGRLDPVAWSTPAPLCNEVPLRIQVAPERSLGDLVVAAAAAASAAVDHGRYPVAELRRDLGLAEDVPLWETMVNVLPFTPLRLGQVRGVWHGLGYGVVETLLLSIQDQGVGLPIQLHLDGNRSAVSPEALVAHADRLVGLLARIARSNADAPLADVARAGER